MSERLVAHTSGGGFRRLGLHGQAIVTMHRQMANIVGNRLGRQHALYFARPQINPSDNTIDWYSPEDGSVVRYEDLTSEAEKDKYSILSQQIAAEIRQLAERLKSEGGSAELVGHALNLALQTPTGVKCLYIVGQKPVLTLWGHEQEGAALSQPGWDAPPAGTAPSASASVTPGAGNLIGSDAAEAPSPSGSNGSFRPDTRSEDGGRSPDGRGAAIGEGAPFRTETFAGDAEGFAHGNGAASEPMVVHTARAGWIAWLLPLLLFSILLVLLARALTPLPAEVVEVTGPQAPAENPAPALQTRKAALEQQLAALEETRRQSLALCRPVETPPKPVEGAAQPVQPPPVQSMIEQKVPEPPKKLRSHELIEPPPEVAPPPQLPPTGPSQAAPRKSLAELIGSPSDIEHMQPPPKPPAGAQNTEGSCNPSYPPGREPEVIVIVDGSGSMSESYMGQTRIGMARRSIAHITRTLPPPVDIGLIDFTDCSNIELLKFHGASERSQLVDKVNRLTPTGRTPLAHSIERAGTLITAMAPGTIIVISDGEDTCGGDPCKVAQDIHRKRPNVAINVVDISGGRGRSVIQCVADATGGRVLSPDSGADMLHKMQQATRLPDTGACKK